MRRIAVAIAIGIAVGCLAWHLGGPRVVDGVPLLGEAVVVGEVGGAGAEGARSDGMWALAEGGGVPVAETRLAARGRAIPATPSIVDTLRVPNRYGMEDPPEPPECVGDGASGCAKWTRVRTPWETVGDGDLDPVVVRAEAPPDVGVTVRAYEVAAALARLAHDGMELLPVYRAQPPPLDPGWAGPALTSPTDLALALYSRTGQGTWRAPSTWIAWDEGDPSSVTFGYDDPPLLVRQTAQGHRAVEAALDALLPVGGEARTVRVWRGDLGPGTLEVGETRRVDGSLRWQAAASAAAVEGPLEVDVPAGRVVAAFLGNAHALIVDYEVEISQAAYLAGPRYDLAHEGLSVRASASPDVEAVELEIVDTRRAPPFPTFSTSSFLDGASVTIEVPHGEDRGTTVRLSAAEGEAWLVGLGGTRAALVEMGRRIEGAGPRRSGWTRILAGGDARALADRAVDREIPRTAARPPEGTIQADLVRPPRTAGASPGSSQVSVATDGAGKLRAFGACDRTRDEALPFGGSARDAEQELTMRGGAFVRARWVGGTEDGEAYDVVLSVADPLATRDGPPIHVYGEGKPTVHPSRLPSFRRALVPLRIVVPHGGVGSRTVNLDLGRGPEPWTVSLSGGRRTE